MAHHRLSIEFTSGAGIFGGTQISSGGYIAQNSPERDETDKELTGSSEWLFPGHRNPKRPMSNNTILEALKRMGHQGEKDVDLLFTEGFVWV